MKYLKKYESWDSEEMFNTKDLSKRKQEVNRPQVMIESEPYEASKFGQEKYGVYIEIPDLVCGLDCPYFYIGDIRNFTYPERKTPYMSYLTLDNIIEKDPSGVLIHPNKEQMDIINNELDKYDFSSDLTHYDVTYRDKLKNEFGIEL